MPTGFQYNGLDLSDILAPAIAGAGNNNTMTNYTTSSNPISFLKPFNTSTYNSDLTLTPEYKYYYSTGSFLDPFYFCPRYVLYGNPQNGTASNSVLTSTTNNIIFSVTPKKMFVVLVGGGGGGGGGGAKSGGGASGGGGGGGGAIDSYWVDYVPGAASFSYIAGHGGFYGQPSNATTIAPGNLATSGSNGNGKIGTSGVASSFTYNGTTYSTGTSGAASGGGQGGGTNSAIGGAGGGGGGGGAYTNVGAKGADSTYTGAQNTAGGVGGQPGNLNTNGYSFLINPALINMTSSQTQLSNSQNINPPVPLIYGAGGHGGKGDASGNNFGVAGEFGAPGCVIVFFYY
jgi:hypothetical protein